MKNFKGEKLEIERFTMSQKEEKEKQQQHKNTNVNSLGIFLSFPKEDQILFKESKSREFKMITPR